MPDSILQKVLKEWRRWPLSEQPQLLEVFTGGLNHHTCLIKADQKLMVLKVFKHANRAAFDAQRWAANLNLAPALLYTSEHNRYCLMEYIASPSLDKNSIDNETLTRLASGLRKLHNVNLRKLDCSLGKFDFRQYCETYLQTASDPVKQIHQDLSTILDQFIQDDTPSCFCHNDLVTENCFVHPKQVQFIDWEYSQTNNPWFDLAAVINYLDINTNQVSHFLHSYAAGWEEKINTPIYLTSRCAQLWLDILWHLNIYGSPHLAVMTEKTALLTRLSLQLGVTVNDLTSNAN